jgi:DNA adenine methylase
LNPPFPYFGGKRRVADAIWQRLGNVHNYVEPFCGSCAVLLARPTPAHIETVNDADGLLANFWRAMTQQPAEVARHADWPVNEADLVARQNWLVRERESLTARLMADPEWCDPKAAGWWVWALSQWIGSGFCEREVKSYLPVVGGFRHGLGVHGEGGLAHLADVAQRLRRTRVACGSWERLMGRTALAWDTVPSVGVVLDPPYDDGASVYAQNNRVSADVRAWCLEHGDIPTLRIALCGYAGEHDELGAHGWSVHAWKAAGGYGNQSDGEGRANAHRERVWFSPHCLSAAQGSLF